MSSHYQRNPDLFATPLRDYVNESRRFGAQFVNFALNLASPAL